MRLSPGKLLVAALAICAAAGQEPGQGCQKGHIDRQTVCRTQAVRRLMEVFVRDNEIPGASLAVAKDGRLVTRAALVMRMSRKATGATGVAVPHCQHLQVVHRHRHAAIGRAGQAQPPTRRCSTCCLTSRTWPRATQPTPGLPK